MEPVEINAGQWYLRALRHDERVNDSAALIGHGIADTATYVARCTSDWASEQRLTWAVCEPTTGEMLGEIIVEPVDPPVREGGAARLESWGSDGNEEAIATARASVLRFARGALGLEVAETM